MIAMDKRQAIIAARRSGNRVTAITLWEGRAEEVQAAVSAGHLARAGGAPPQPGGRATAGAP